MAFDGEAFVDRFNTVWNGHDVVEWITSGTPHGGTRYEVYGCDVLALRDGRIAAKRSFRKGVI